MTYTEIPLTVATEGSACLLCLLSRCCCLMMVILKVPAALHSSSSKWTFKQRFSLLQSRTHNPLAMLCILGGGLRAKLWLTCLAMSFAAPLELVILLPSFPPAAKQVSFQTGCLRQPLCFVHIFFLGQSRSCEGDPCCCCHSCVRFLCAPETNASWNGLKKRFPSSASATQVEGLRAPNKTCREMCCNHRQMEILSPQEQAGE